MIIDIDFPIHIALTLAAATLNKSKQLTFAAMQISIELSSTIFGFLSILLPEAPARPLDLVQDSNVGADRLR